MIHNFVEDDNFTPDMEFGEFMRKKRRLMGLSQTDLGEMLGIDQHTVSKWERGISSPPFDNAKYIAFRLGGRIWIDGSQKEQ